MLCGNHTRTTRINYDAQFYEDEMVPIIGSTPSLPGLLNVPSLELSKAEPNWEVRLKGGHHEKDAKEPVSVGLCCMRFHGRCRMPRALPYPDALTARLMGPIPIDLQVFGGRHHCSRRSWPRSGSN